MDILFEILFELIFEDTVEIGSSKKISKWTSYPLITLILLFYIGLSGLFAFLGVKMLKENNIAVAVLFWGFGLFLIVGSVLKFWKMYSDRK